MRRCSRLTRVVGLQAEDEMSTEPNRSLTGRQVRYGVKSAAASMLATFVRAASRLRFSSSNASRSGIAGTAGQVASFRAGLRSALHRSVSLWVASTLAAHRGVAVQP